MEEEVEKTLDACVCIKREVTASASMHGTVQVLWSLALCGSGAM